MYDLLNGFKIVEGASFIAAPLCGLTLSQLGADVIRFDPIGGGPDFNRWPLAPSGRSFYWEGLNKGKRSIAIDLARPEGREIAEALATLPGPHAGLFVTNYPAGSFLSYQALSSKRRDLIVIRITGSSDGRNALDYTVNCAAGYPAMTGPADVGRPVNHVLPAWDIAAGLTAAVSLLAAAHSRMATHLGREIQVPLSNVAFGALSALGNIAEVITSGRDRPRYGNALYGSFGRDFCTADGARVMIVAVTRRQWLGLIRALDIEVQIDEIQVRTKADFEKDEGARFIHRDQLFPVIQECVRSYNLTDLADVFDRNGVCWGQYRTVHEAVNADPRASDLNPMFEYVTQPSGEAYIAAGFPGVLSDLDRLTLRPAPHLGDHTDEILATELGLSASQIGHLHDRKIVAASTKNVR